MKRLMYWFIGFTVLQIEISEIRKVFNAANKFGVRILNIEIYENYANIYIFTGSERKMVNILNNSKLEYRILKRKGAFEFIKKYKHRAGIVLGIIVFFAAMYISPKFIWRINVEGLETLSKEYICELLENEGVYIGAYSPDINRRKVYASIVQKDDKISWITVNFIGGIADVEVSERDYSEASEIKSDGANIVAKKDGQITETDVLCGERMISKGDIVKKGDVLVSGVYDTGKMGTRYVYADANIYAVVSDEFVIEVPLENSKKVYTKEVVEKQGIKLFEKSIIFYKNYSNLEASYDTISKEEKLSFMGFEKLPFSLITSYALCYENVPVVFTEEEAVEVAQSQFYSELDKNTNYADMISVEESYTVENSVLIYRAVVEAIENIALTSEFQIKD